MPRRAAKGPKCVADATVPRSPSHDSVLLGTDPGTSSQLGLMLPSMRPGAPNTTSALDDARHDGRLPVHLSPRARAGRKGCARTAAAGAPCGRSDGRRRPPGGGAGAGHRSGEHLSGRAWAATAATAPTWAGNVLDRSGRSSATGPHRISRAARRQRHARIPPADWDRATRHGGPAHRRVLVDAVDEYRQPVRTTQLLGHRGLRAEPSARRSHAERRRHRTAVLVRRRLRRGHASWRTQSTTTSRTRSNRPSKPPASSWAGTSRRCAIGCHGPNLSGGKVSGDPNMPLVANITPHESGLKGWTEADFIRALREGKRKDGTASCRRCRGRPTDR